jgi:hypothetical protein
MSSHLSIFTIASTGKVTINDKNIAQVTEPDVVIYLTACLLHSAASAVFEIDTPLAVMSQMS